MAPWPSPWPPVYRTGASVLWVPFDVYLIAGLGDGGDGDGDTVDVDGGGGEGGFLRHRSCRTCWRSDHPAALWKASPWMDFLSYYKLKSFARLQSILVCNMKQMLCNTKKIRCNLRRILSTCNTMQFYEKL